MGNFMKNLIVSVIFTALTGVSAFAENPVPDRRLALTRNLDFYGSDLQSVFDTTLANCQRICLADPACLGFTFNQNSNACFPKGNISETVAYEGAISGRVYQNDPGVLANQAARKSELSFLSERSFEDARALSVAIAARHVSGEWLAQDHIDAAARRQTPAARADALAFIGAALNLEDRDDLWVEYGRLAFELSKTNGSEQARWRRTSLNASVNAYLRSRTPSGDIAALEVMAKTLETLGQGRQMIPALRLALSRQDRPDLNRLLEEAIGKYGFRVTEHKTESDAADPRICAVFSEDLAGSGMDYTPFVQLPNAGLTVSHDSRQICVDGVSHGQHYRVVFREGLPAASGEVLIKSVELTQYVRDRAPLVRFPGRAFVLPRVGEAALPVETVNTDRVSLVLRRVSDRNLLRAIQDDYFGRPLNSWQERQFSEEISETVWNGEGLVENELNRNMTTRLPMTEALVGQSPGIYALTATIEGDDNNAAGATQWFVLSDIGLATMSGADGLHVFARGLGNAQVRADVTLTLLSRANAVLGEARTDARGYATFGPGVTAGQGAAAPALLIAEEPGRDITFLSLTDPEFDLSDRGVEGRAAPGAIDVFLTTDRGAYRAGDTIFATALARDGLAEALPGLPLTLVLKRPDGVEYSRHLSDGARAGGHVFEMSVAATAPRGTWRLAVYADTDAPALTRQTVLVEDFLPERIDFELDLPDRTLNLTEVLTLGIDADYLFGAPGSGLAVDGDIALRPASGLPGFPGYRFGRYDQNPGVERSVLPHGQKTDAQGMLTLPLELPQSDNPPDRPMEASVTVRVSEGSGRPVERGVTRLVSPGVPMIGIRPLFDDVAAEGSEAAFEVIGLDGDLNPEPMDLRWTLSRVNRRYQWYQLYGNWHWEPVTSRTRVATGDVRFDGSPVAVASPVEWGRYELRVERLDGGEAVSVADFYAGWYVPADTSASPDVLEVSLDQEQYAPGDTATLRLVPRYAGKALVTVVSNRLIDMKTIDVAEGENLVTLDVTDEWGSGAYVTATVIRPMDAPSGQNPARALGLAHASIDPGAQRFEAELELAEKIAPRSRLDVTLRTTGVAPGDTAWATIAAVDVGILNLTGFESPDPEAHYFGQRRLGVGIRDIYGRLIDGANGAMGAIRSGGDASLNGGLQSPPPTEELVTFFSGPVQIGTDGTAQVGFDVPAFNGTLRLMAVVWSETGVARDEAEVLVRDPVVVTASLPRFLAPGDQSRLLLEVVHTEGPAGRMGLDVVAPGLELGAVPSGITLAEQGKEVLEIPFTVRDTGLHDLRIALTTPDGRQLVKSLVLPVLRNDPHVAQTSRFQIEPGREFTLDHNAFANLAAGTGTAMISAGPLARLDTPGLLQMLDRYPYGCTEQITSAALPLLYFGEVADVMDVTPAADLDRRIDAAIREILSRQSASGGFGLWYAGSGDFWLDAYVSDFLAQARTRGFDVPDLAFRQAMNNLRNQVNYQGDFDSGGEALAYALYVLAREGAAATGDLRYYADVKSGAFSTPMAAAHLGAALASYGDQLRADAMFRRAAQLAETRSRSRGEYTWRVDYGTWRRDTAAVLTLALEAGSAVVDTERLADRIATPEAAGYSTQEAAWTLMAAHGLSQSMGMAGVTIDGTPANGPLVRILSDTTDARPVVFGNAGQNGVDITLTTLGVPEGDVDHGGNGYRVERAYYTIDGAAVQNEEFITGQRYVTVLSVIPHQRVEARLMVNDPLPAGLEIDNPTLLQSGDVSALDWLSLQNYAETTEFRSDRFLAAIDWRSADRFQLAYIVRATTPGVYHHPAAGVEDMYRPAYRANSASGRITIRAR